jgi:ribosomal-protein-alanine N-acetyltransferase
MIEASLFHAPALALMHEAAFPADPWTTASFLSLLQQPGITALIDERGGFIVLRTVADEAEIITLGVTAPRTGIGRSLVTAAISAARAAGAAKIFLEVAVTNAPARALYAAMAFRESGHRRAYYPDGTDALILTL